MSIRTWAIKASLNTAIRSLKLDRISSPNNLTSDLVRTPDVIERALYTKDKEQETFIVAEQGMIAYLEPIDRDSEQYECKTLPEFMRRFFSRKIDFACTIELARLEVGKMLAGEGKLSNEQFSIHRKKTEVLLTERLENYLCSTQFKFYMWLARV